MRATQFMVGSGMGVVGQPSRRVLSHLLAAVERPFRLVVPRARPDAVARGGLRASRGWQRLPPTLPGRPIPFSVETSLSLLLWIVGGLVGIALLSAMVRAFSRSARTRAEVQEEIRRLLHGGVIDRPPGRGSQVRGRLGQVEVTVEVHRARARPRQSPMWRVLAVGPVPIDRP